MQDLEVLFKNYNLSAETINSSLSLVDGYYTYSDSIGGSVVNEFNVKDYLDDERNLSAATSYFNFLKQNSTQEEFKEIFYNNKKLSNSFNEFYRKTILTGVKPTPAIINRELINTSAYTYFDNYFINDLSNTRTHKKITTMISYNTGQSYYITVFVPIKKNKIGNYDFSNYFQNTYGGTATTKNITRINYVRKMSAELSTSEKNKISNELIALIKSIKSLNTTLSNQGRNNTIILTTQQIKDLNKKVFELKQKILEKEQELRVSYSNVYIEENERIEKKEVKKKIMLNGFVDLNFNDNESEYWTNDFILPSETQNSIYLDLNTNNYNNAISKIEIDAGIEIEIVVKPGFGRG